MHDTFNQWISNMELSKIICMAKFEIVNEKRSEQIYCVGMF